jgi:hypothetical protein
MPVTVRETWYLKDEYLNEALRIFQEMDDILGPEAHVQEGWSNHARFFQDHEHREIVEVFYVWASRALHDKLLAREEPLLADFQKRYFRKARTFEFLTELPVEVE